MFGINDKRIFNPRAIDLHSIELIECDFDSPRDTDILQSFPVSNSTYLQEDVVENTAQRKYYSPNTIQGWNQKNKLVNSVNDKKEGLFAKDLKPAYVKDRLSSKYKPYLHRKNKEGPSPCRDTRTVTPLHSNLSLIESEYEDVLKPALGYSDNNSNWLSVDATSDSKKEKYHQILVESFKHYIEVEIEPIMKMPLMANSIDLDFSVLRGLSYQASYASPLRNVPELDVENSDDEATLVSHITRELENTSIP